MLVILSGVAGAGKDTVKKELMKRMKDVDTLPSYTSRPKTHLHQQSPLPFSEKRYYEPPYIGNSPLPKWYPLSIRQYHSATPVEQDILVHIYRLNKK